MGRFSNDMVDFGKELLVTLVYRKFLVCDELFCQFREEMAEGY